MLVFQSILTTIVNLCIWPLVLIGGVENVFSSDQLWWPWGKGLNPPKKCFEFKCQPLPGFLAPSKLTLIGALASLHLIMSTRRWVWELYMLPRTLNLDTVFEWFYLFPILKKGLIFFILMRLSLFHCWYCEAFVPLKGTPWTYIYTVPVGIVFRTGDVNSSPPKAFCIPQLPLLFWANN